MPIRLKALVVVATVAIAFLTLAVNSVSAAGFEAGQEAAVAGTQGDGLRLRATIWGDTIVILREGAKVTILDIARDGNGATWYKVSWKDKVGWLYGLYLMDWATYQVSPPPGSVGFAAVDIAYQYLGYPYVYGGSSPSTGFDCSGFVQFVYGQLGIWLPRDTWSQINVGTPVSVDELVPGDIVFFANTYGRGISHNGIYVGGGYFINARSEGWGVRTDYLWDSYWSSHYYGARRP